ncbi:hypothetical protein TNCV_4803941 [Trichonephila clavipes]|nr:hypothetical protein TNCV_4803941 [Trichonephila clavipes]
MHCIGGKYSDCVGQDSIGGERIQEAQRHIFAGHQYSVHDRNHCPCRMRTTSLKKHWPCARARDNLHWSLCDTLPYPRNPLWMIVAALLSQLDIIIDKGTSEAMNAN